MRKFKFYLILHQGGAINHGAVLNTLDYEIDWVKNRREAEAEADRIVYGENAGRTESDNWWTRSAVQEVK